MASVGNDSYKTFRSLHELDHQGTVFFFVVDHSWRSGRSFVQVGELLLRSNGMLVSRVVHGKVPTRQLHSTPIAVSGSGHTGN